jgi:hypothetical protein
MSENIILKLADDIGEIIFKTAAWLFMIVVVLPVWLFTTYFIHPNVEFDVNPEPIYKFIETHPKHMEWTQVNNKLWGTAYTTDALNQMKKGKTGIKKWGELLKKETWKNRIPELTDKEAEFMANIMNRWGRDVYAAYLGNFDMRDFHTSNWDEFMETGKGYALWHFDEE